MADTDFSAKEFYSELIKGVFRTFNFPESKWKSIKLVPDLGRTYFQDHKNDEDPFSQTAVEKIRILYDSALRGDMTISYSLVTSRLSDLLQKRFYVDFSFLNYLEDDTEKLRMAKRTYWLDILDKITSILIGKTIVSFSDMIFLHEENSKIRSRIKLVSKGTCTFDIIDEPERKLREMEQENTKKIAVEVFTGKIISEDESTDAYSYEESQAKIDESIKTLNEAKKGIGLFFLNCSITNVTSFINKFPKYSRLEIKNVRTCKTYVSREIDSQLQGEDVITFDEWTEKMSNGEICPLLQTSFICSGYDIKGVKEGMERGISYIFIGSPNEFKELKKYVDNVMLFLVVPEHIEQVIYEMDSRGYYADVARDRLKSLRDSIDFMLSNDGFVLRWESKQGRGVISYYAGLIDSIISMNPLTKQLNAGFLKEYRDTIEKMTRE